MMTQVQSKYVKSMLCFANINDIERVERKSCLVLQHFDYHLDRMLGEKHELLNNSSGAILNISIRVQPDDTLTDIYRAFECDSRSIFSVMFNAHFDDNGYLVSYENAMIVTGTLMNIEERFGRAFTTDGSITIQKRATLDIKVVILELKYQGGGGNSVDMKF